MRIQVSVTASVLSWYTFVYNVMVGSIFLLFQATEWLLLLPALCSYSKQEEGNTAKAEQKVGIE